jgi:putative transposase
LRTGRSKVGSLLPDEECLQRKSIARSRPLPAALSARARILSRVDGELDSAIACRPHLTKVTVGNWRTPLSERRPAVRYDDMHPGVLHTIDDERVEHLIKIKLHTMPSSSSTRWSGRVAASRGRNLQDQRRAVHSTVRPAAHRNEGFNLSDDPFFIKKLRDAAGLPLSTSDIVLAICVDEKNQSQVLVRTQLMPPKGVGYVEGITYDYRH